MHMWKCGKRSRSLQADHGALSRAAAAGREAFHWQPGVPGVTSPAHQSLRAADMTAPPEAWKTLPVTPFRITPDLGRAGEPEIGMLVFADDDQPGAGLVAILVEAEDQRAKAC